MKKNKLLFSLFSMIFFTVSGSGQGSKFITSHGYENCIELSNGVCRVVLEPNCGGRVLVYEIEGKNALYVDPEQNGYMPEPDKWHSIPSLHPCAGRFDIGPEKIKPDTKLFWLGKWRGEITGEFSARLTSQVDEKEHLQLVRDFQLDPKTSKFKVIQTIKNLGDSPRKLSYWGRTFATGGGICIVPLSKPNRFPEGYLNYTDSVAMRFKNQPKDNIKLTDDYFLILGAIKLPKLVFDSDKGWLAYLTKDDLLFVKTYDYNKSYEYGEMAAVPLSIWYFENKVVELEPMGPWKWIDPKGESSFSETWHLLSYNYPKNKEVDVMKINAIVKALD
jgi:hypothetical protein